MFPYIFLITFFATLTNNSLFAMDSSSSMEASPRSQTPVNPFDSDDECAELAAIHSGPATPTKAKRRAQTVLALNPSRQDGRTSRISFGTMLDRMKACSVQADTSYASKRSANNEENTYSASTQEVSPSKRTASEQIATTSATPRLSATSIASSATPETPATPGLLAFGSLPTTPTASSTFMAGKPS